MSEGGREQIVTPYLCCKDAAGALDFYAKAFGAREPFRFTGAPQARSATPEIEIEGGRIMISGEWEAGGVYSPEKYGGTPCSIYFLVADVDALAAQAGSPRVATIERAARMTSRTVTAPAWLRDPFGHRWNFATPIEEVSKEELRGRMGDSYLID